MNLDKTTICQFAEIARSTRNLVFICLHFVFIHAMFESDPTSFSSLENMLCSYSQISPLSRVHYIIHIVPHTIFKSKSFAVAVHARVCLNPRRAGKSISPKALYPIETEIIASSRTHPREKHLFTQNFVLQISNIRKDSVKMDAF